MTLFSFLQSLQNRFKWSSDYIFNHSGSYLFVNWCTFLPHFFYLHRDCCNFEIVVCMLCKSAKLGSDFNLINAGKIVLKNFVGTWAVPIPWSLLLLGSFSIYLITNWFPLYFVVQQVCNAMRSLGAFQSFWNCRFRLIHFKKHRFSLHFCSFFCFVKGRVTYGSYGF